MKNKKKEFQNACRSGTSEKKQSTMEKYIKSQRELRSTIEEAETKTIENRLEKLHEKAKINTNTVWTARKRANRCQDPDYNTYTEEGKLIINPEETKGHIANYFEELYQAREGTENYSEWTKKIKEHVRSTLEEPPMDNNPEDKINEKEFNQAIKKLKRNKSLGPDKIPNELFIEANKQTREILREIRENVHRSENIPPSWEEGEIIRLYKGKGQKGKCSNERGITLASNVGKVYERIIYLESEERRQYHKGPSRWKTRMLHSGPHHSPETNDQRNQKQATGLDAWASRVKCPARFVSHLHDICIYNA